MFFLDEQNSDEDFDCLRARRTSSRRRSSRSSVDHRLRSNVADEFDQIEQEIIERVMQIERDRQVVLRRQIGFIISRVQEFERRRYLELENRRRSKLRSNRTRSISDDEHQRQERFFRLTMTFNGTTERRRGDELMVVHRKKIVFKAFLKDKERFSFRVSHDRAHGSSATVRLDFYLNDLFELQSEVKLDEAKFNDDNSLVRLESVEAIGKKQKKERLDPPETKDRLRQVISTERREQTVSSSSTSVDQSSNEEEPSRQVDENVNPTNDRNRQLTETKVNTEPTIPVRERRDSSSTSSSSTDKFQLESNAVRDQSRANEQVTSAAGLLEWIQTMTGNAFAIDSNNEDQQQGIQNIFARLGIGIQNLNHKEKSSNVTPRKRGNLENVLLVHLDKIKLDSSIMNTIRSSINVVEHFNDVDDCLAFINSVSNEQVYLLVIDEFAEKIVSRVEDLEQVSKIYVHCDNEEQRVRWSTDESKVCAVSTEINELFREMSLDVERDNVESFPMSMTTGKSKVKVETDFLVDQIVKEILLDHDEISDAKQEMVSFLQQEYSDNEAQLRAIDSFDNEYEHDKPLNFYRANSFLWKILNKAFRIPEIDVLFKVRLFIQHLNQFIVSSSWRKANIRTVYRSTWLTDDQIDSLKKHADLHGLISFSGFLRASLDRPKTSSSNRHRTPTDKRKQVFFRIELSSNDSFIVQDDQVLFSLSVVGQIENFTKDNDGLVQLQLKLVSSDDQSLERILEPVRKEIRAPYPSLRVVKLFIELKEYSRAVLLGQQLLAQFNGARKDNLLALARLYHSLGTTLYETEEYEQALDVINKSHELYLRFLPEDAPQLSPTWNNMGSIYLKQGKIDLALQYHERALNIQLKSPSPDLPSIISYSNNIGGVYLKLERYDEALLHFKRALQIEEQTLPKNHHDLAGTYHRIGGVYFRQNNHEKALEYYDKTLEVELASLPDDHPTVAVTYHNRGTALEGLGRLEEALDSAEKAVQRLLKTLSKDHPQVKMNQSYADRLKQKLWVKQLFSSGN